LASNLSASDAEGRFQAAQIGGPLSWIESGGWGGVMGGGASVLSKLMPRPGRAPSPAAVENEPQVSTFGEPATSTEPNIGERTVRQGRPSLSHAPDSTCVATTESH